MAGNSISLSLVQLRGRYSPVGPTSLLFFTHFKITYLPQNSVSLPLGQIGGEQYPLNQPIYYFIPILKLHFAPS
ncbi:hypothetical protein Hanom_Chr12g01152961 [Helianthus anomalus]